MLSTIARRSATTMMAKSVARPTIGASFSSQTYQQVETIEDMLKNLHWSDVKDEMHCIKSFMNECKTNHAIQKPDASYEQIVKNSVNEIQAMINGPKMANHDEVFHRIHDLKMDVKGHLYQFA